MGLPFLAVLLFGTLRKADPAAAEGAPEGNPGIEPSA